MRQLQERLQTVDTGGIDVRLVTISFDPENDTPQRLQAYAQQWGADGDQWQVVTGDPFLVKQVIGNGFYTYYQQQEDGRFEFDPAFVLTDGWGLLRAEYRTATPDLETVARDVGLIAQEAHNSQGAARYAYEAAHLFLCYPR
jgi:protein SCO1/2